MSRLKFLIATGALAMTVSFNAGVAKATTFVDISIFGGGGPTATFEVPLSPTPSSYSSGNSFELTGLMATINGGSPTTDTFDFYNTSQFGGLADSSLFFNIAGAQYYNGSESNPTFVLGEYTGQVNLNGNFVQTVRISETPLLAALPLFATGLGALGLLCWRMKKKAAALAA